MVRSKQLPTLKTKYFLLLALVGILFVGLLPRPLAAQTPACAEVVVMQRGQSLALLAARVYGTQDGVADIIAATNAQAAVDASYTPIRDANAVEAGWKLCLPAAQADALSEVENVVATSTSSKGRMDLAASDTTTINRVALEENDLLMERVVAARLGDDGLHPLTIEYLRQQSYATSSLTIERTLPAQSNYRQYIVSYQSEGLTLYALMTVPRGEVPVTGWPVVIFNHGYIEPAIYSPTERYTEYIDAIASSGYIVLRPDMRGHGDSEGAAIGAYSDPGYTIDVLNALEAIKQYPAADPNRIGMWGHSMGGYITARAMVVSNDIKAGVIWAGVVASYEQLATAWDHDSTIAEGELPVPDVLMEAYGTPEQNPGFWSGLSANSYVSNISGPVQLHHGTADTDVPVAFSDQYYADLIAAGQSAEYYVYAGDDHNITAGFDIAMRRSLEFLDAHVKNLTPALAQLQSASPAQLVP